MQSEAMATLPRKSLALELTSNFSVLSIFYYLIVAVKILSDDPAT